MRKPRSPDRHLTCQNCHKPFTVPASRVTRKNCSEACYKAYRVSREAMLKRFWSQVEKTPSCWLWTGWKLNSGYGETYWSPRKILAHRLSYVIANGEIPPGKHVLHKCDVPLCVRPDHLYLGTDTENHRDMVERGRTTHGERHFRAKLTAAQVREIRANYVYINRRKTNTRELAEKYGVSPATIGGIVNRTRWTRL